MKKSNILAVITARGGSKGIKGKNIKLLKGKPLIAWTIETAKKSELITRLILSTDDEKIARVSKEYGLEVPFMRPNELAKDETPHIPVMQHAVKEMEKIDGMEYDYIVILQPTSPFRTTQDLDATIKILVGSDADSAVSIVKVESKAHPMKIKKLIDGVVKSYCIDEVEGTRRQDLPDAYRRSGDVYAMTRECLMKKNTLYGDKILGHEVDQERYVDIDEPIDWIVAEEKAKQLLK